MTEHQSSRTLVKSAPELWAECSDAASLARHLGAFGEIRITRLEPQTTVAWEGAAASGTVKLEPSGWGTRVTLTMVEDGAAVSAPEPGVDMPAPEPEAVVSPPEPAIGSGEPRMGVLARLRLRWRRAPAKPPTPQPPTPQPAVPELAAPEPAVPELAVPEPAAPEPEPADERHPVAAGDDMLVAALDSLGRAHHRPYSRA